MSSEGYANRLSKYPNKGVCGLPENLESKRTFERKVEQLVKLMKQAKHIVVLTGAGISTSAGIPDFRGPNGIWTKEKRGKKSKQKRKKTTSTKHVALEKSTQPYITDDEKVCEVDEKNERIVGRKRSRTDQNSFRTQVESPTQNYIPFELAEPTPTHRAITTLANKGIIKYCVTQNVDGLHRRSGLSRSKHAVLHGCIFTEKCEKCETEYFRDFDVGGLSFQKTGRQCDGANCAGDLRDTILDWEDELPEKDWMMSQYQCSRSDLCICLGTSLRIEPAGSLPTTARKFVIVNKQVTPYDSNAEFCIRASVDDVFEKILDAFGLQLPDKPDPKTVGQTVQLEPIDLT